MIISRLSETSRSPFNFAKGVSKLALGLNVEIGVLGLALLFVAGVIELLFTTISSSSLGTYIYM